MTAIQTAIATKILNFRFGAVDQGFEFRDVDQQAGDETCTIVSNSDGTWSIQSPNHQQWVSIQADGTWQAREAHGEPGPWEKFTRIGNTLTELPKEGVSRPLIQIIGRDL